MTRRLTISAGALLLLSLLAAACGDDSSTTTSATAETSAAADHATDDHEHDHDHDAPLLVAADHAAAAAHVWDAESLELVGTISDVHVAEHPGMIVLPGGRLLATDDVTDELLLLDPAAAEVDGSAPLAGNPIHIAVDPDGRYAAVSTGAEGDDASGADGFTLVDLDSLHSIDVPLDTGEPGVAIGGQPLSVLHRNDDPGLVEAYPISGLLDGQLEPVATVDIEPFGHGEAITDDGLVAVATDEGLDVVDADGDLSFARQVPWDDDARQGGRGYYLRLAGDGTHAISYLRIVPEPQGDAEHAAWERWDNDVFVADLSTGHVHRGDLGPGLVYRFAVGGDRAAMVRMHPDGDVLHMIDVDPSSPTFATSVSAIPLPPITDAPVAGAEPWEAQGRRVGLSADGTRAFVSHGGDGLISVVDVDAGEITATIESPSSLDAGGDLVVVDPDAALVDTIGR